MSITLNALEIVNVTAIPELSISDWIRSVNYTIHQPVDNFSIIKFINNKQHLASVFVSLTLARFPTSRPLFQYVHKKVRETLTTVDWLFQAGAELRERNGFC